MIFKIKYGSDVPSGKKSLRVQQYLQFLKYNKTVGEFQNKMSLYLFIITRRMSS